MRAISSTTLWWMLTVVASTACVERKVAPSPSASGSASAASATTTTASTASPEPPSSAPPASIAPLPPPPANVERLDVPSDLPAFVVRGASGEPPRAIFVPGVCSNANAYMLGFPEAARRAGGVVAIDGDLPCPGVPGFRTFSWDLAKAQARMEAALAAAGHRDAADALTVIGYSQGAAILEQLVAKSPARYARVVIIAAPSDPIASRYAKARGVVTMACSRDAVWRMKLASKSIAARGVPSTYIEMPGCTHGELAEGDARFDEAFTWLGAR